MKSARFVVSLFAMLSVMVSISALNAAVTGVWAVDDGQKIYRYQTDSPSRVVNDIWDGKTIRLEGFFNEVLGLQLIVEADSFGAQAIEIEIDPPVHAASGIRIGGTVPASYGPGGTIELFSQHYLKVEDLTEIKSKTNWLAGSPPPRMSGWIPDALIPVDARQGMGGLPLDIPRARKQVIRHHEVTVIPTPETQNQGFWVDLHLPRAKDYPAGMYLGQVRVLESGKVVASLPLEVKLLPHYLPDENHSNVWLFHGSAAQHFPELSEAEVEKQLKFMSHRHRVDLVGGCEAHKSAFSEKVMNEYLPYLDGSAFSAANGYRGPGEGCGEKLFVVGMYGSDVLGRESDESIRTQSDLWVRWFDKNAPGVRYFYYIIDEPGETQFEWIDKISRAIHENPGPGKRLPVFLTRRYTEEIKEAIDIWAGYIDLEKRKELAEGKDYWFYNGNRPYWGHTLLEVEPADLIVNAWIKYLYAVPTWFIWEGTQWEHNSSGPKGHLHQRVFSNPLTYINWWWDFGNMDGVLIYPGRMPHYPDEDRGLSRLLPSIRLKNVRRGQQDYELMWMAQQAVGKQRVLEVVKSIVPKAFSEAVEGEAVPWSEDGEAYAAARKSLRALIN
ncbi:hypothetical protein ACFL4X_00575 [Gemmatimonadota bacterium]